MRACLFVLLLLFCSALRAANIYYYANTNMFSPVVKNALPRVYVPNGQDGTVSVIDTKTYQVIETFKTGKNPQHVVPSYDLQTLFVLNDKGNSVTPIDPMTGKPGKNISVDDPYNLYFTTDGQFAIVVCEARRQLQFRDPKTMALRGILPVKCGGANHMDFSVDGSYAIVTCEFSGELMKVDLTTFKVISYLPLVEKLPPPPKITIHSHALNEFTIQAGRRTIAVNHQKMPKPIPSMPQDIRSSADGSLFFVADMVKDGVIIIDPERFVKVGFIPTGIGTHAIYPSRDGKLFYVSNRGCHHIGCGPHGPGSITVVDPNAKKVVAQWPIPQGGSPDMGNVTADGKELWLSGRYDREVYVFNTTTGELAHRIKVGRDPHGLAVWPQPGRYSLGHTGNMR